MKEFARRTTPRRLEPTYDGQRASSGKMVPRSESSFSVVVVGADHDSSRNHSIERVEIVNPPAHPLHGPTASQTVSHLEAQRCGFTSKVSLIAILASTHITSLQGTRNAVSAVALATTGR